VKPVGTCRQSPSPWAGYCQAAVTYSVQFRSAFRATTTPSQPRPLPSLAHSWTHLWC